MGEYAKLKNGTEIKIGTCENMYYLRFEDRGNVLPLTGSLDPSEELGLRFRVPFPDEDDVGPGYYPDAFRGEPLINQEGQFFKADEDLDPGLIQISHASGLLINVPCYHGAKLPDVGTECKAFWNGKGYFFELIHIKNEQDGLFPIIGCRHCGSKWKADWAEVLPYIRDQELLSRLEKYAEEAPVIPS